MQRKVLLYDKSGEEHFNLISALHKSVRSSDADAALYWLARMLEGGEDRMYIGRRLVRMAIEDIGLADPRALEQAIAAHAGGAFPGNPGRRPGAGAGRHLSGAWRPSRTPAYTRHGRGPRRRARTPSPSRFRCRLRNAPTGP